MYSYGISEYSTGPGWFFSSPSQLIKMDINAKLKSYAELVHAMREEQKAFFAAAMAKDFARRKAILPKAKALEKKVDNETEELLKLADQNFQPELFR